MKQLKWRGIFIGLILWLGCAPLSKTPPIIPEDFGSDEWAMENYQEAVEYLKYLTTDRVRRIMESAPERLHWECWDQFWSARDPAHGVVGARGTKHFYFARIAYANEHFRSRLYPGWLTDRGETYIRLGPPNRVERDPMPQTHRATETWEYWGHGVTLYFIDWTGLGDYILLNPTDMYEEAARK